ncbi:MAG: WecB/TagA/CpsF family glycosyltransferase [Clostridia bacterium]|nr:WecB/TagA/CpsF family glycosyltransferase [Clostridia bacterium]
MKRLDILGIHVDKVTKEEALNTFKKLIASDGCQMIITPNSEIVMSATKDHHLRTIINDADMVIPDGIGLVYASRIIGQPLRERVTGIDFLESALNYLNQIKGSIFLLGSKPGVANKAAEKMKEKYPDLLISGTYHGYFGEGDEETVIQMINDARPDFLCVALGSPKQEKMVKKYQEQLKAKAAIGIGGSLDVWAGELKRAPKFYQDYGLEWLYRLIQQPSRYKRMAALPAFILKVFFRRNKK